MNSVIEGSTLTYTIVATNAGPSAVLGATVTDLLPAQLTAATWTCAASAGSACPASGSGDITASVDLLAGGTATFTLTATVGGTGTINNTATIAVPAGTNDPNPADNSASDNNTTIVPTADLSITKTDGVATVNQGGTLTYTIVATNHGPSAVTGATVSDLLSSDLSNANWTCVASAGSVCPASGSGPLSATVDLLSGGTATFTLTATVSGAGTITNTATITAPLGVNDPAGNNSATDVTTAAATADLSITKTDGLTAIAEGGVVTYTIVASNAGPSAVTGATVTDNLPAQMVDPSWTCTATPGSACPAAGVGNINAAVNLAAGGTVTFTVSSVVNGAGSLNNTATITAPLGVNDPTGNNSASDVTLIQRPDLAMTKSHTGTFVVGLDGTYTLAVRNIGPVPTTATTTVVDTLPAGLGFVSASGTGWTCGTAAQVVSCSHPAPLAAGATSSITLVTSVGGAALPNVINRAHVSTAGDADPANDAGADPTTVSPAIDLAITKTPVGVFRVGGNGVYTMQITNVGAAATIGDITVTDTLPAGLTFVSGVGTGWACSVAGPVVTCIHAASLAPGASTSFTLTVGVGNAALPTVVNRVYVSTFGDDGTVGNNTSATAPVLVSDTQLLVEKSASRDVVEIADVIDYRIDVRAAGTTTATDVVVNDALPSGFAYVPGTARVDGVVIPDPLGANGPRLAFTLGTVPAGGNVVLTYRVRVGAGARLGDGINRAVASSAITGAVSATAAARVRVEGGVFTDRAMVIGKVYVDCECDSLAVVQGAHEIGVPGVRVILEDGTAVITDVEGKFSFYGLSPRRHVLRVDERTLPAGAELIETSLRNAGDARSRFVDLTVGELHAANFAIRRTDAMLQAVLARRAQGEISGLVADSGTVMVNGVPMNAGAVGGLVGQLSGVSNPAATGVMPSATNPAGAVPLAPSEGGAAVGTGSAAGAGMAAAMAASAVPANAYRPLLSTGVPLLGEGLTNVMLRPDSARGASANGHRIDLRVPQTTLAADGVTPVPVLVRVVDARGGVVSAPGPVTLETSLGRWLVEDLDPAEPGVQTLLGDSGSVFPLVAPTQAGNGQVRATTDQLSTTQNVYFAAASQALMATGLVQARVSLRSLTQGALSPARADDGFEEVLRDVAIASDNGDLRAGARGALYLRGKVKGDYLLTLALDSEREEYERLQRDIRPDEFYPVYGDASMREFDAQSAGRFYVRVDKERSFFLYGDFQTPSAVDGRVLSAYDRTLTGARQHLEGRRGVLDVFASQGRLTQRVDELRGMGISGPYALNRRDARLNTERVEIITRDRNQPSMIVKVEPQQRFADYTLEPFTGRLLFRRPIPSLDADLNPVSIRVTYEVEQGGEAFWQAGVSGQTRVTGRLELGGTYVRDANPSDERSLMGLTATLQLAQGTFLLAEAAQTDGDSLVRGTATRLELRHRSQRVEARVFAGQSDSGFANLSSTFAGGRRELGARGSYTMNSRTRMLGEALRTEDRVSGGRRDGVLIGVERAFYDRLRVEAGFRHASETSAPASPFTVGATPNETNALRTRITADLAKDRRASVWGEFEQDIQEADQRRAALGADLLVAKRTRLYARHELLSSFAGPYALNGAQSSAQTVVGLDMDYLTGNQAFTEYRARDAFAGRDAEAAIGLRNRWTVKRGLVLNSSFERVERLTGSGLEATAITGGVEYTRNPLWRGTARVEFRDASDGDSWLGTVGYARKVSRDVTFLGRSLLSLIGEQQTQSRSQLGFAFRQTDTDTWNALARYEYRYESNTPTGAEETLSRAHIISTHLNVRVRPNLTVSGQYATKLSHDDLGAVGSTQGAHLLSARGLIDLSRDWDAALIGRTLFSGSVGNREYGLGAEVGRRMARNMRLAVGANFFGVRDEGLTDANSTQRGLYIDLGWKFAEDIFGAATPAAAPAPVTPPRR